MVTRETYPSISIYKFLENILEIVLWKKKIVTKFQAVSISKYTKKSNIKLYINWKWKKINKLLNREPGYL